MGVGGNCAYMTLEYEVEGHRPRSCECVVYGGFDIDTFIHIYIYIYIYIYMLEFLGDCASMRLEHEVDGISAVLMRVCDVWGLLYIYIYIYMYICTYSCIRVM